MDDTNEQWKVSILELVSRGNAVIAELLRLKDHIPTIFHQTDVNKKYAELINDFSYFSQSEIMDKKIESSQQLQEHDEKIRDTYLEVLVRFYVVFENIYKFAINLNQFVENLENNVYIQESMENIFLDQEGCQLMCETLYLYGVMLLVTELYVPGSTREKLLVSYYRYSLNKSQNFDEVCQLFNSTKKGNGYPDHVFSRIPINENLVSMILGKLRTDDIYHSILAYPLPQHRSTALANQASMLFVCLYFDTSVLHNNTANMREIVDKFFPDNWIVSIYMGITVQLIDAWEPYRAAKLALSNSLETSNVKQYSTFHADKIVKLTSQTEQLLKDGALTEENVLDHTNKILNLARECNVTIRWLILHTSTNHENITGITANKKTKQIKDMVCGNINMSDVFQLLLNTSEFELKIKELLKALLEDKQNKWNECKQESSERLNYLIALFSGSKPLPKVKKNQQLEKWFSDIDSHLENLSFSDEMVSVQKLVQFIQSLDSVKEFHELSNNAQVEQWLNECLKYLNIMVRSVNVKDKVMIHLQIIADLSYAWKLIDQFTPLMQDAIKHEPSLLIKLRALFLKLSTSLEIPLLRINQAESEDLISVSQYYSNELVTYMQHVLQIIPQTMFTLMADITKLQTNVMLEVPTRLDKDKLKDYAQLDTRFEIAHLTHSISVFTQGILRMKSTLVGIVCIDPKQLLHSGIKKQLAETILTELDKGLTFNAKSKINKTDLMTKLSQLAVVMDGHKRSFEYIQDYVGIYGLKVWYEVLNQVIEETVSTEIDSLMSTSGCTFIGRLADELISMTDPKLSTYVENTTSWFNVKTQKEIFNMKIFSLSIKAIGISGLVGLDNVLGFRIVKNIQSLFSHLHTLTNDKAYQDTMAQISKDLSPNTKPVSNPTKHYPQYLSKMSKYMTAVNDYLIKIGQLQILRQLLRNELSSCAQFESKNLHLCLETLNKSLLNDLREYYSKEGMPLPTDNQELMRNISAYLKWIGQDNPYHKIYVTTRNIPYFPLFMFLYSLSILSKVTYSTPQDLFLTKKGYEYYHTDCVVVLVVLHTLFHQFHRDISEQYLIYMSQYIKSHLASGLDTDKRIENIANIPHSQEIYQCVHFVNKFLFYQNSGNVNKNVLAKYLPDQITYVFQNLSL
uniref:WASH complex subunit strumpellin n=1 Tax=Cacopsylla melanoneura TaxID=428564 RepID=A0A8D8QYM0_9HEMI